MRLLVCCLILSLSAPALGRPLAQVREGGALMLCAHPNALPYSSKDGERHGFQIETAAALAREMGLALELNWVTSPMDVNRADCDILLDAIDDAAALDDRRLKLSQPYRRGGVALAVAAGNHAIAALGDLNAKTKVGILPGSLVGMVLQRRHVPTSPAPFEDELLDDVAAGGLAAAAVTPTAIDWYNRTHAGAPMRAVDVFGGIPDLNWNVAVGVMKPDAALLSAVDAALRKLVADGTITAIYARYGVALAPPRRGD